MLIHTLVDTINVDVGGSTKQVKKITNRIQTNFYERLVIQRNATLFNNGITLDENVDKKKLGSDFDPIMSVAGVKSQIHGSTYLFVKKYSKEGDHKKQMIIPVYKDNGGAFPFLDEETGEIKALVEFWQIDVDKPEYMRLYEIGGVSKFVKRKNDTDFEFDGGVMAYGYNKTFASETPLAENRLPIVELKSGEYGDCTLTPIKSKIDAYTIVESGLIDGTENLKQVYLALDNFQGTIEEAVEIKSIFEKLGIAASNGETYATARPETISIQHDAHQFVLKNLRENIYDDYMGYDTKEITGGSLTNVAIKSALRNHLVKVGYWEQNEVVETVRGILDIMGLQSEAINYKFDIFINDLEQTQMILDAVVQIGLPKRYALSKLPFVSPDEIDEIYSEMELEETGYPEDKETENLPEDTTMESGDIVDKAEQAAGKQLNGAQTQSLISIISQYSQGTLTLGQAINVISVAIGVSKDEAQKIIEGV